MTKWEFDPLPDLADDHRLWVAVLGCARVRDPDLHGLLHGLRCGASRLERRPRSTGDGDFLKLDYSALLDTWDEQALRAEWLDPYRVGIVEVFQQALTIMEEVAA